MRHILCTLVLLAGVASGQTLVELLEGTIVYEDARIAVIATDLPAADVKTMMETLGVPHPTPRLRIETGDGFNLYYAVTMYGHVLERETRVGIPPPLDDEVP